MRKRRPQRDQQLTQIPNTGEQQSWLVDQQPKTWVTLTDTSLEIRRKSQPGSALLCEVRARLDSGHAEVCTVNLGVPAHFTPLSPWMLPKPDALPCRRAQARRGETLVILSQMGTLRLRLLPKCSWDTHPLYGSRSHTYPRPYL